MRRALLVAVAAATIGAPVVALMLTQTACSEAQSPSEAHGVPQTTVARQVPTTSTTEPAVEITIAAVGDVMVHKQLMRAALHNGTGGGYDFKPTFASIAPYLRMADYTVVNLETRLAGPTLAYTTYPRFNTPGELADALADAGVDLCATANNHTLDKDWPGIVNTLDRLDQAGLAHVGTYRTAEEKQAATPFIVDIQGIKVAFINYTDYINGFTPPYDWSVDFMTTPWQVATEAKAARDAGADVVIAILHWGRELNTKPNGAQIATALGDEDFPGLLNLGVDVILGSHPHVLEPAVGVKRQATDDAAGTPGSTNGYVLYSLGNFCSDMKNYRSDYGAIVYVHIKKVADKVEVTGISYMAAYMQEYGSFPREVVVEPLLPKVAPANYAGLTARQQKRLDTSWDFLTQMFYDSDMNIVPLSPADIESAD